VIHPKDNCFGLSLGDSATYYVPLPLVLDIIASNYRK
jgi:hypothetical protein